MTHEEATAIAHEAQAMGDTFSTVKLVQECVGPSAGDCYLIVVPTFPRRPTTANITTPEAWHLLRESLEG